MRFARRLLWCLTGLSLAFPSLLEAGERRTVTGYATATRTGLLLAPAADRSAVFELPAAPDDRSFLAPAYVRWEIELSGARGSTGLPAAQALRSSPSPVAWPAGEELSPERFAGAGNGFNPGYDPMDPLGVRPGSGIPDYDGDGVPDDRDAFPGDPAESRDTDGDGVGDAADPDDDNDGMPDAYESANGFDPLVADAAGDADRDGFPNLAEYEAGTDPRNGASFPRFTSVTAVPPDTVRLTWLALPGHKYAILRTSLLAPPVVVAQDIRVSRAAMIFRDVPMDGTKSFFLLKVLPVSDP